MRGITATCISLMMSVTVLVHSPAARAQFGEDLSPPVSAKDVDKIGKTLAFTPEQRRAATVLFDGHLAAYQAKARAMTEAMRKAMADFQKDQDAGVFQKQREQMAAFAKQCDQAEASLLADLRKMLTDEQAERWPAVERMRRRDMAVREGIDGPLGSDWPKIDLLKVVEEARLKPEELGLIKPTLDTYELDLDRALIPIERLKKRVLAQERELEEAMERGDFKVMQGLFDEMLQAVFRIRDVNRNYTRRLVELLPESVGAKLDLTVRRLAYPMIHADRGRRLADRAIAAAERLRDLDEVQKQGIKDLKERYLRDAAAWEKQAETTFDRKESEVNLQQLMGQMNGDGAGDDGADVMDPLKELRARREELDKRTVDALKALLTEAQRAKLPKDRAKPRQVPGRQLPATPGAEPDPMGDPEPDPEPDPDPDPPMMPEPMPLPPPMPAPDDPPPPPAPATPPPPAPAPEPPPIARVAQYAPPCLG